MAAWTRLLLLVGLAAFSGGAWLSAQALCSSAEHGPYCGFVNNRPLPAHHQELLKPAKNPLEGLLGARGKGGGPGRALVDADALAEQSPSQIQEFLSKIIKQLETQKLIKPRPQPAPTRAKGVFIVKGSLAHAPRNFVWLKPAKWVQKPGESWIMLSLFGGMNEQISVAQHMAESSLSPQHLNSRGLVLYLGDPDTGFMLHGCSKLVLFRTQRGIKRHWLEGVWIGRYSCLGSRTTAKMVITTSRRKQDLLIKSTISFDAELFPGRDSTGAGCKCLFNWAYEGKSYTNGQCSPTHDSKLPWCFIERGSCAKPPAGLNWDYCPEKSSSSGDEDDHGQKQVIFSFDQNGDFLFL